MALLMSSLVVCVPGTVIVGASLIGLTVIEIVASPKSACGIGHFIDKTVVSKKLLLGV